MSNVETEIKSIISSHLGVEESQVTPEAYLRDDLNADTLGIADIAVALEEKFKITIPQEEAEKFNTVSDITTAVSEHLNEL